MIIVTLSVVCTLKGISRHSIQRIKAMLLCIEYGILFVGTVNRKIKVCNALNAMFVDTVNTGICTLKGMSRELIQRIKAMLLCIEYGILLVDTVDRKIKVCKALNTMFANTVDTGVCTLKGMSRQLKQRIKAMLLCIEYGIFNFHQNFELEISLN